MRERERDREREREREKCYREQFFSLVLGSRAGREAALCHIHSGLNNYPTSVRPEEPSSGIVVAPRSAAWVQLHSDCTAKKRHMFELSIISISVRGCACRMGINAARGSSL